MAFDITSVSVGDRTLKSQYDQLLNNDLYLRDDLLGTGGAVTSHVGTVSSPIFDHIKYGLNVVGRSNDDAGYIGHLADIGAGFSGPGWLGYGKTNATAGKLGLACGHQQLATGGVHMHAHIYEYSTAGVTTIAKLSTAAWTNYTSNINRDIDTSWLEISGGTDAITVEGGTRLYGKNSAGSYTAYNYIRAGKPWVWYGIGAGTAAVLSQLGELQLYDSGNIYSLFDPAARTFELRDTGGIVTFKVDAEAKNLYIGDTALRKIIIDPYSATYGESSIVFQGTTVFADNAIILHEGVTTSLMLGSVGAGGVGNHMLKIHREGANGYLSVPQSAGPPGLLYNGKMWYDTVTGLFTVHDSAGTHTI